MERLFDNLDGYYMPAFLYIQLNENIDFLNFENHPDEVKGTFIHESVFHHERIRQKEHVIKEREAVRVYQVR